MGPRALIAEVIARVRVSCFTTCSLLSNKLSRTLRHSTRYGLEIAPSFFYFHEMDGDLVEKKGREARKTKREGTLPEIGLSAAGASGSRRFGILEKGLFRSGQQFFQEEFQSCS